MGEFAQWRLGRKRRESSAPSNPTQVVGSSSCSQVVSYFGHKFWWLSYMASDLVSQDGGGGGGSGPHPCDSSPLCAMVLSNSVASNLAVVTPQPSGIRAPWSAQASCRNFLSSHSLMHRPLVPRPLMHRHLMGTRILPGSRGRRRTLEIRAELARGCLRWCRSGMRRESIAGRQLAHHRARNPCGVISLPTPRP